MTNQEIHYIRLVGIKLKEALLIESFLNMASDGSFIVKVDDIEEHPPKAVLVDELFHSDSLDEQYPDAKIVIIGDDTFYEAEDYLHRPLKWSTFEKCVILPVVEVVNSTINKSVSEATPISEATEVSEMSINNVDSTANAIEEVEQGSSSIETQIAEIDTNHGLVEISEIGLTMNEDLSSSGIEPVAQTLVSELNQPLSEFSISQISVKEATQANESSDYSESVSHSYSEIGTVIEEDVELVEMEYSRVKAERELFEGKGLVLGPNIIFWENFDCLMTVRSRPVLYILSSMGNVYSEYNYLDWGLLLKSKYARVYPLPKDWSAQEKLTKYPLSWLVWFSSIARSRGYLLKSINKEDFFMLDAWPSFDQIYNDNNHLRLSSLLSTAPYDIRGLVAKTRLPTKVIVAYLNACKKQGLLKTFPSMEVAMKEQKPFLPPKAG